MRVERARYFLAAVESGSLRAAAQRCGVSQPTLGEQITLLEEELDVVVLTRSRSGVRPTAAGQAMIESMRRLIAAEDLVRDTAAGAGGSYRGSVAIGAISVVVETVVAPVVGRLREQHPALRFTVSESSSTDVEAAVASGELDFGVITMLGGTSPAGLTRSSLITAPIGALVRTDHPLAQRESVLWRDLATWPVVTMRRGTVMWDRLHASLPDAEVVVHAMSARSVRAMVAHGAGIGLLAPLEVSLDLQGLRWIRVSDAEPLQIGLVQRSDTRPSPSSLVVRRLIHERAAELLQSVVGPETDAGVR